MTPSPCRSDAWIETASGLRWSPQDPGSFAFSDLALGISRICRYSGQLADGVPFYSVAEHSVLMHDFAYQKVPGLTAADLAAVLFHDLHEGLLGDVPSPLKPLMPGYVELEETMGRIVAQRYGGTWPAPPIVKELDRRILVDERRGLLNPSGNQWGIDGLEPLGVRFKMLYPQDALELFLERASLYLGDAAWVVHIMGGQSDRHPQSNYHR